MKSPLYLWAAALLAAPLVQAQTITTTQNGEFSPWGPGTVSTFSDQAIGESLTIPAGVTRLNSFTFSSFNSINSTAFNYTPEIYLFDAPTPTSSPVFVTGAPLYIGTEGTVPATGTVSLTIDPHITVTPGTQILVFLNPAGVNASGATGVAQMGSVNPYTGAGGYTGGQLYVAPTLGGTDPTAYLWSYSNENVAFIAFFGSGGDFASMPGLNASERGIASSIDAAGNGSSPAISSVTAALTALPASDLAGALDQLSPAKFGSFASTTAFNNETFETQDMDTYLAGLRDDATGNFALGNGKLDSSGLVINDPNVDPGLQMIHSRMLAWEDPVNTMTDVPGSVLGGVDMKDMKAMKPAAEASSPWDLFLRGNVVLAQGFSQGDVPHFDDNTSSVVLGADYHFSPHLVAGLTASYAHTDATLDTANSSATVDSYSPGVYASWADGGGYANFLGRYSYNTYTESRDISFLGQTADGATTGNEGVVDLDGGYDFHCGALTYGPVAGVQYTHLTVNSYTEQNSYADLSVKEDQADSLRSRVGGSVRYNFKDGGMTFTPHLEATWQHEFLTQDRGLTSSFTDFGGGSFTVRTPNTSDDSALVDFGLDAKVDKSITVFGDYLVQAGQSNYFGQSVQAGVRVNF